MLPEATIRVKISFWKLTDERHALEIARPDGRRERVECETRSYLEHDFLHYAVESEAGLSGGFWGRLARGTTLEQMNDRKRGALGEEGPELAAIEQIVGALHEGGRPRSAAELHAGLTRFAESLGTSLPGWVSTELVERVRERMRRLRGHWRATAYGSSLDLDWHE